MNITFQNPKCHPFRRLVSLGIVLSFLVAEILMPVQAYAQEAFIPSAAQMTLPKVGTMVPLSETQYDPLIKGLTIDQEDPFNFQFVVHTGRVGLSDEEFREHTSRLVRYFFAALTVPEDDLWVNLSPYENDRIIPTEFGTTDLGRDLLAQDYMLKQLTASLIYPEDELGKAFWDKVYKRAQQLYGTTDIPVNTFNKVWVVPEKAVVYEHDGTAYVVESELDVLLEQDYLALQSNLNNKTIGTDQLQQEDSEEINKVSSEVVREVIIPAIRQEINHGKNFSQLRQIYNSVILAAWYKQALKNSLLGQIYVDQNKTLGVNVSDKEVHQKIYDQYVEAFKEGVYSVIREEYDPVTQEIIPRKYFSGGAELVLTRPATGKDSAKLTIYNDENPAPERMVESIRRDLVADTAAGLVRQVDVSAAEPGEAEQIVSDDEEVNTDGSNIGQIGNQFNVTNVELNEAEQSLTLSAKPSQGWRRREQTYQLNVTNSSRERFQSAQEMYRVFDQQSDQHNFLVSMLNELPYQGVDFVEYDTLQGDLFGFASADHNIIALHSSVVDNPSAAFHEIGEYLVQTGQLKININDESVRVELGQGSTLREFTFRPTELERLDILPNGELTESQRNHYGLRLLQRTIFKRSDPVLSSRIDLEQNKEVLARQTFLSSWKRRLSRVIALPDRTPKDIREEFDGLQEAMVQQGMPMNSSYMESYATILRTPEFRRNTVRYLRNVRRLVELGWSVESSFDRTVSWAGLISRFERLGGSELSEQLFDIIENAPGSYQYGKTYDALELLYKRLNTFSRVHGDQMHGSSTREVGKIVAGFLRDMTRYGKWADAPSRESLRVESIEKVTKVIELLRNTSGFQVEGALEFVQAFIDSEAIISSNNHIDSVIQLLEFQYRHSHNLFGYPTDARQLFKAKIFKILTSFAKHESAFSRDYKVETDNIISILESILPARLTLRVGNTSDYLDILDMLLRTEHLEMRDMGSVEEYYLGDYQVLFSRLRSLPSRERDAAIGSLERLLTSSLMTPMPRYIFRADVLIRAAEAERHTFGVPSMGSPFSSLHELATMVVARGFQNQLSGDFLHKVMSGVEPGAISTSIDAIRTFFGTGVLTPSSSLWVANIFSDITSRYSDGLTQSEALHTVMAAAMRRLSPASDAQQLRYIFSALKANSASEFQLIREFINAGFFKAESVEDFIRFENLLHASFDSVVAGDGSKALRQITFLENIRKFIKLFTENPDYVAVRQDGLTALQELLIMMRTTNRFPRQGPLAHNNTIRVFVERLSKALEAGIPNEFSAREIVLDLVREDGYQGDPFLLMIPNYNAEIEREGLDNIVANIDRNNYTESSEKNLMALFVLLKNTIPVAQGLDYEQFKQLVQGAEIESQYHGVVEQFIQAQVFGRTLQMSEEQQKALSELSYDLARQVMESFPDTENTVTFRELMRFQEQFGQFYRLEGGIHNSIELFVLTAYNNYGRVLRTEQDKLKFKQILVSLLYSSSYRGLIGAMQVSQQRMRGNIGEVIDQISRYADYENLGRIPDSNEVSLQTNVRAQIERSRQVQAASLLVVDDNNSPVVENVLRQISEEDGNTMINLPISAFSKRRELFGMYMPREALDVQEALGLVDQAGTDELRAAFSAVLRTEDAQILDAVMAEWGAQDVHQADEVLAVGSYLKYGDDWRQQMVWEDGLLVKISSQALSNPDQQFYIAMDNISSMPGSARLSLNPVVWERLVEIPESGTQLRLPDNVNFVMTMHKDTRIDDDSFTNRPLVQYVDSLNLADAVKILEGEVGVSDRVATQLTSTFFYYLGKVSDLDTFDSNIVRVDESLVLKDSRITFSDIVNIARRVSGVLRASQDLDENQVWRDEAYQYLILRTTSQEDRDRLKKLLYGSELTPSDVRVSMEGEQINFNGVSISAPEDLLAFVSANRELNFREVMRSFYGYIVTDLEEQMLSQLARSVAFGTSVVQIEGPSGEGKTEIGRVFAKLLQRELSERTINRDTDLTDFRGQIRGTRDRSYELYEAQYVADLETGNRVFLYNEINTNEDAGLYDWFYPESVGRDEKYLAEFAYAGTDSVVKTARIAQDNFWIYTINPDNFGGRVQTPSHIHASVPTFYMAQNSNRLPEVVNGLFLRAGLDAQMENAEVLANLHNLIRQAKKRGEISSAQDITPRELATTVSRFQRYIQEGVEQGAAFRRAIDETYVHIWQNSKDVQLVRNLVDKEVPTEQVVSGEQALVSAVKNYQRPVLVFHSAATDVESDVYETIRREDSSAEISILPLSQFHRQRHFIGGLMPVSSEAAQAGVLTQYGQGIQPMAERLGILPDLIRRARFSRDQNTYVVLRNYTHLNPQLAPLFNEFLQTGRLDGVSDLVTSDTAEELFSAIEAESADFWSQVRDDYRVALSDNIGDLSSAEKLSFARWFYGEAPNNLRFIGTADAKGLEEVNAYGINVAGERTLSPAELNRFTGVNLEQGINGKWVRSYLDQRISADSSLADFRTQIQERIITTLLQYRDQQAAGFYGHNRLGRGDIDAFLSELQRADSLDENLVNKLAFYTLGIGLRPRYLAELVYESDLEQQQNPIAFETTATGIELIIDELRFETDLTEVPDGPFLAATKSTVQQLAAMAIARRNRRTIILEGNPGGGKTSSVAELAKRLGIISSQQQMYEDIDLGEFLGKLAKKGSAFINTAEERDAVGRYIVPFLRAYTEGELFLLDEGAVGVNPQEAVSYLAELANMTEFNLGLLHPGLHGQVLKRHSNFQLIVTQNPANTTKGRLPLLYGVDTNSTKIWVENRLDIVDMQENAQQLAERTGLSVEDLGRVGVTDQMDMVTDAFKDRVDAPDSLTEDAYQFLRELINRDAIRVLDHHLDQDIPVEYKNMIAEVHNYMARHHPDRESFSPRQIIRIAQTVNLGASQGVSLERSIFRGLMISYMTLLSPANFDRLWEAVDARTNGRLASYVAEWQDPIDVSLSEDSVQLNGMRLARSAIDGNIGESDFFLREDVPSQTAAIRAAIVGLDQHMPIGLFTEDGSADALDFAKKVAHLTGYQLETLWSHSHMTRMHILNTVMPRFQTHFDRYGIKREDMSNEFIDAFGFLARHLLSEEEYATAADSGDKTQTILFFHMMDVIPERQLVLLNELLTTKSISLIDREGQAKSYRLPEWTHFMVSASLDHSFSSAYANRLLPVRIRNLETKEMDLVIRNRYPNVTREELRYAHSVVDAMSRFDRSAASARLGDSSSFSVQYGFSQSDVLKLARTIQLEKQNDVRLGRFKSHPLYYLTKALYLTFELALNERDVETYENKIIEGAFLDEVARDLFGNPWSGVTSPMYEELYETVLQDTLGTTKVDHDVRVNVQGLAQGQTISLDQGIKIRRDADGFSIATEAAHIYRVKNEDLTDWTSLAKDHDDIQVRLENGELVLRLALMESVGGVFIPRDEYNLSHAIPENEVPTRQFVRYTDEVVRLVAATLRSWQAVEDNVQFTRSPRVVMWNGHTGTAKTTLARNISRMMGVPLYILNAYEDLKVSDVSLGLRYKAGTFEVGVKEFLARIGTVNGQRIALPSQETSNRKILLVDEANASPQVMDALMHLFRGEKRFTIEYAGEEYDIEVDDEVMVILTFNPVELYGGRGQFNREINTLADKYWTPNPMSYSKETVVEILQQILQRGESRQQEDAELLSRTDSVRSGHQAVEPQIISVEYVDTPVVPTLFDAVNPNAERIREEEAQGRRQEGDQNGRRSEIPKEKKELKQVVISYDVGRLISNARAFKVEDGYLGFAENILEQGLFYALADNNVTAELWDAVIKAAASLDPQLVDALNRIKSIYGNPRGHKEREIHEAMLDLRRVFTRNNVAVFLERKRVGGTYTYYSLVSEVIERTFKFTDDMLVAIGEDPALYEDYDIKSLISSGERYGALQKGLAGFFEGENAYAFRLAVLLDNFIDNFQVSSDTIVDWTAQHELGHALDILRLRVRGIKIPRGIRWSQLARSVNSRNIGFWLSENVELNAMLFPILLTSSPYEYIKSNIFGKIRESKDAKDAYVQASKGILNGLVIALGEEGYLDGLELISDELEDSRIDAIERALDRYNAANSNSENLNAIGRKMYQDAQTYLGTTGKGVYRKKVVLVDGTDEVEEVLATDDMALPDTEMEYEQGDEDSGQKFDTPQAQEDRSPTIQEFDSSRDSDQESDSDQSGVGSSEGGEVFDVDVAEVADSDTMRQLSEASPQLVQTFLEIFSGSPKTLKIFADTGDEIDLERIITGDLEPFYRIKVLQGLAELSAGITVDVSGSTRGELQDNFTLMAGEYSALFHYAAVRNPGVEFSLSAIGENYHRLLDFDASRERGTVENAINGFQKVADFGGINTVSVIEGLRQKYADRVDREYKLEIVFTDGGETSRESFSTLRQRVKDLENELGIDVVFVGIGTKDVENYSKFINLPDVPDTASMMQLVLQLSLMKVGRGNLPDGNLLPLLNSQSGDNAVLAQTTETEVPTPEVARNETSNQNTSEDLGGIDLTAEVLNLQIKRDPSGAPLPLPMQNVEQININGIVPVIINITPMTNLPLLLGLDTDQEEYQKLSQRPPPLQRTY